MEKRIEFFFEENSITESTDAEIEAVVTLHNGSVIILPKSHCIIECAPTQRKVDVSRVCENCGQPRSKHHGKGKFFCPGHPTTYA